MITTVTLNPAVDKTIEISGFKPGEVNRILKTRVEAGGKGINVSKVLNFLGIETLTTGFLGGESGNWIKQWLKDRGIKQDFVWVNQETRTNIKIADIETRIITDINDQGKEIESVYLKELYNKVEKWSKKSKVMVFSGSIPKGLSNSIYADLIQIAKNNGCKTILDAEGEALLQGMAAKPYMIKPNIHELESTLKIKMNGEKDIVYYCKKIAEDGINLIVVSMGEKGAVLITKDKAFKAEKMAVKVKTTVGAGDSMVAAFAYGLMNNYGLEETFKIGIAAAALCISQETACYSIQKIEEFKNQVNINLLQ